MQFEVVIRLKDEYRKRNEPDRVIHIFDYERQRLHQLMANKACDCVEVTDIQEHIHFFPKRQIMSIEYWERLGELDTLDNEKSHIQAIEETVARLWPNGFPDKIGFQPQSGIGIES